MEYMSVDDELLLHERRKWSEGFSFLAGIDEAGRGCMAGPVVAAAVMFTNPERIPAGLNDSKQLSPRRRMELREALLGEPSVRYGIGEVSSEEIDRTDILRATWRAMYLALEAISGVQFALVDGNPVKGLSKPSESLVKGDAKSASIAAASILAKTHRDLWMEHASGMWPEYAFEVHKGYCTQDHIRRVRQYGICPIHRKTFEPIRSLLNPPDLIQGDLF